MPVPYLCPFQQHSPFHASVFSSTKRLTDTCPPSLLPRSIVRLRQQTVSQSVYSRVEGQQCEGLWKADHRQCELQHGTRGAVRMGQEVKEGAPCVREGRKTEAGTLRERLLSFLAAQEATIVKGSLKTPGEKPRFHGVEILKIFLTLGIRKPSTEDLDFRAGGVTFT